MEKDLSTAQKIGGTLCLALFGLLFLGISLSTALPELVSILNHWNRARAYVGVQASVRSAELKVIHGEETSAEIVQARFDYRFRGHDYTSRSVSIGNVEDDFDPCHRTVHTHLAAVQLRGERVTVWVDPAQPERALYDRRLRWKSILFRLPFAVLFPLIGLGAWAAIWVVWRPERIPLPGELRAQSHPGTRAAAGMAAFTFFWNMLSWPIAILFMSTASETRQYWVWLVALFPLVGVGLIWVTFTIWQERRRIGRPMLEVLQAPTSEHVPLRGRIHFLPPFATRLGAGEGVHPLRIVVKLQETVDAGEERTETTLWERCVLDTVLARGTTDVAFSAMIPAGLPLGELTLPATLDWLLEVHALGTVTGFALPEAALPAHHATPHSIPLSSRWQRI